MGRCREARSVGWKSLARGIPGVGAIPAPAPRFGRGAWCVGGCGSGGGGGGAILRHDARVYDAFPTSALRVRTAVQRSDCRTYKALYMPINANVLINTHVAWRMRSGE